MQAETQSAVPENPGATAESMFEAAFREQARLRATLSAEEYEKLRQVRVQELIEQTKRTGAYAETQGMTDKLLEQLLADEE
jgi:hypothetical protein